MTRFREAFPILYVADVARASDVYTAVLGFDEVRPPGDGPWGDRLAYFRDRDGHLLHVTAKP